MFLLVLISSLKKKKEKKKSRKISVFAKVTHTYEHNINKTTREKKETNVPTSVKSFLS
jgi:hypothetical protein